MVRNGRLVLVDFHQARQRVALGVDHAGAQLVGEQPSAAVRADTELFLELQGRDAVGVGRHQVGGPEPDGERQLAGVQDRPGRHRGLPAAAGALEGVCFSAQRPSLSWPHAGQTKPSGQRISISQAAQASSSGNMCWKARRLLGTCFMWWLRRQERIRNILPVPPP